MDDSGAPTRNFIPFAGNTCAIPGQTLRHLSLCCRLAKTTDICAFLKASTYKKELCKQLLTKGHQRIMTLFTYPKK